MRIYIDDLALNCYDDLEKSLGFYMDTIQPRDFNTIEHNTIETYTKYSEDLFGEIYFYNHIPTSIKDMFPILINYDVNGTWYTMEKVHGLSATNLYLAELLTETNLENIMLSIQRIQTVTLPDTEQSCNINIYDNYSRKLKKRLNSYDYSVFPNFEKVIHHICEFLQAYEETHQGKCTVVHGDPVLTNILINEFDKIKFIDMRGTCGMSYTLCGDWLYDWAKLYQSLLGYDSILMDKVVSMSYKLKMIQCFETLFVKLFSQKDLDNVKMITNSLLLSLIPLHNNDKCILYYNLISF